MKLRLELELVVAADIPFDRLAQRLVGMAVGDFHRMVLDVRAELDGREVELRGDERGGRDERVLPPDARLAAIAAKLEGLLHDLRAVAGAG